MKATKAYRMSDVCAGLQILLKYDPLGKIEAAPMAIHCGPIFKKGMSKADIEELNKLGWQYYGCYRRWVYDTD